MKSGIKALLVLGLVGVFIVGLVQLKSNTYGQNPLILCCNEKFPQYSDPPTHFAGMNCTQPESVISPVIVNLDELEIPEE